MKQNHKRRLPSGAPARGLRYALGTLDTIWTTSEKADFQTAREALNGAKQHAITIDQYAGRVHKSATTASAAATLVVQKHEQIEPNLKRVWNFADDALNYGLGIRDHAARMSADLARLELWFSSLGEQIIESEGLLDGPAPKQRRLDRIFQQLSDVEQEVGKLQQLIKARDWKELPMQSCRVFDGIAAAKQQLRSLDRAESGRPERRVGPVALLEKPGALKGNETDVRFKKAVQSQGSSARELDRGPD